MVVGRILHRVLRLRVRRPEKTPTTESGWVPTESAEVGGGHTILRKRILSGHVPVTRRLDRRARVLVVQVSPPPLEVRPVEVNQSVAKACVTWVGPAKEV